MITELVHCINFNLRSIEIRFALRERKIETFWTLEAAFGIEYWDANAYLLHNECESRCLKSSLSEAAPFEFSTNKFRRQKMENRFEAFSDCAFYQALFTFRGWVSLECIFQAALSSLMMHLTSIHQMHETLLHNDCMKCTSRQRFPSFYLVENLHFNSTYDMKYLHLNKFFHVWALKQQCYTFQQQLCSRFLGCMQAHKQFRTWRR